MPLPDIIRKLRGVLAATLIASSVSTMAMAGAGLPQAAMAKLADPDRIVELLDRTTNGRARIIVEFVAPARPDAALAGDPGAADRQLAGAIHQLQDQILGRAFATEGGLSAALSSPEFGLKRMDYSPMFALSADAALLARLASDPSVVRIHEDRIDRPYLNVPAPVSSLQRIQMPEAYAAGATGSNRHVAILDSGGRRSHKFLNTRIVSAACYSTNDTGEGASSLCPGGVTASTDIASADDCDHSTIEGCGHGTHVAGTAAGFNSSPLAGEPLHGVARDARLISINVFTRFSVAVCNSIGYPPRSNGCILTFTSDQIRALERVYALRGTYTIDAVNMSLGGGAFYDHCDDDARKPIIDSLRAAGIATVIAAGNDGYIFSVGAPGCISTAITVANATKSDELAYSSNWGDMVDVVAPGSDINASYLQGGSNIFAELTGTSMASPHVAGAIAALRSARPAATVDQIESALKTTGTIIQPYSWGAAKPRINVNSALTALGGSAAVKAVMSSPAPGSTLNVTTATFNWTAGTGVTSYWLYVGSSGAGSANIFSGGGAQRSRSVANLPSSGTLNVRLMSYISGAWQFNDYTYTMNAGVKAVMTTPTPGSTITSTSATFSWTAGSGATTYWLTVGTEGAGSSNIFTAGGTQTSRQVTGLPASGTLHVRLASNIFGAWQYNDYTYTMNAGVKAVMTWPAAGSVLTNPWASFTWTAAQGSSGYWLMIGTNGAGSANILSTAVTGTTRSVTGLPFVGTLNVRLMTYVGGGWQSNDYTYTMAVPAMMSTPAPGSKLPGPGVMFQWTGHASLRNYWLYVGTGGPGSANIFSAGVTNTWRWVGGLPASGTVNVRLMSWMGTAWQFRDYTYTGGAGGDSPLDAPSEEAFSSLLRSISLD